MRDWAAYYVFSQTFRDEVCAGFDASLIARALADRGMLLPGADGKLTRSERLPNIGTQRLYVLTPTLLEEGVDA